MRALSIRLRLTVWFVAILVLILVFYSGLTGVLLWRNLARALNHHLEEDFHFAAQFLERDDTGVSWRGGAVRDVGYEGGVRRWVEVWDPAGRLVYRRGSPEHETLQRLLPAAPAPGVAVLSTPAGRVRALTSTLDLGGQALTVRVGRTEADEWPDLLRTLVALAIGIPICLVAAGAGGYLLARRALAPVAAMTAQARLISAEDLRARVPILNPHDELGQLATVFNETFDRLERSFSSLQRFTADASHELRTPLTAIRSVGEVGVSGPRTAAEYRDIIGSMLEEAGRLSRLVDGLLLLSQADAGRRPLVRERTDLADRVRDTVGQLAVLAEERGQRIDLSAPAPVWAAVDRVLLGRAVANLVDNAIKYSPVGACIRIAVTAEPHHAVIEVADEGPGIPAEHRERVFERFHRIDDGRSREVGGSGLGLSIAAWAAAAHGGRIEVVPDVPAGATFRIRLPLDA